MKLIADAAAEPAVTTPDGAERRVLSYGAGLMLVEFRFEAGKASWEHSHPHEQITNLIEGEFEMVIEGEKRLLKPGEVAVIPSHVRHAGKAVTDCRIIDVFHPVRQEYR